MKLTAGAWMGLIFLLPVMVAVFWFWQAENFSDRAVSGTYTQESNGETWTLILKPDHRFQQELDKAGTVRRAEGSWRVSGEGHIAFSSEFLIVSGEELSPAGQAYGQIENCFGIVSITLAPNPDGPKFHKKVFR
jgi:hypothetical protein